MKSISFRIKNPCQQSWENMEASQQGRYCNNCKHIVFDFTNMDVTEIEACLKVNLNQKICGRIQANKLEKVNIYIDENVFYQSHLPLWKKNILIILLIFGNQFFHAEFVLAQETTKVEIMESVGNPQKSETKVKQEDDLQMILMGDLQISTEACDLPFLEKYDKDFNDSIVSTSNPKSDKKEIPKEEESHIPVQSAILVSEALDLKRRRRR